MTIQKKIEYLQENYYMEWVNKRREVDEEISQAQTMFCVCGKLATGFHESSCRKFRSKVDTETVKRLENIIK